MKMSLSIIAILLGLCLAACQGNMAEKYSSSMFGTSLNIKGASVQRVDTDVRGLLPPPLVGPCYALEPHAHAYSAVGLAEQDSFYVVRELMDPLAAVDLEDLFDVRKQIIRVHDALGQSIMALVSFASQKHTAAEAEGTEALPLLNKAVHDPQVKTANKEVAEALDAYFDSVKKRGIMVFEWDSGEESGGKANVGTLASGNKQSSVTGKGFAILGGVRFQTLYAGKDILEVYKHVKPQGNYASWAQVPTTIIQARHVVYVTRADLVDCLNVAVDIDPEVLETLPEKWREIIKAKIEYNSSKIWSLTNSGVTGVCKIGVTRAPWNVTNAEMDNNYNSLENLFGTVPVGEQWSPFLQIMTPLDTLRDFVSMPPEEG